MNTQKSFEIIYNNTSKFISEIIDSYELLVEQIFTVFKLNKKNSMLEIFYIKEGESIYIINTETLKNMMIHDKTNNPNNNFVLRINILEIKKENIQIKYNDKSNETISNSLINYKKKKELFELILFDQQNVKDIDNITTEYRMLINEEIRNIILNINESDIESELYLQEMNNISTVKKLIEEIIKSRMEALKKITDQVNKENINLDDVIILKSNTKTSKIVFNEKCDLCLSYPIIEYKYVCLFCENMILCKNCEIEHKHPSLKINDYMIPDVKALSTIVDTSDRKKGFLSDAKEFLFGSNKPKVRLFTQNSSKVIYVKPNTEFHLPIFIENVGSVPIPKFGLVIPLNNKDLGFKNYITNTVIEEKKIIHTEFKCITPNRICEYNVKFIFFHQGCEIECVNVEINLKVCIDKDSLINEFFSNDHFIKDSKLSLQQKEKIFTVIYNDLSIRNSFEIANILAKHNWNISESIDELSKNIKQEKEIFSEKLDNDYEIIIGNRMI